MKLDVQFRSGQTGGERLYDTVGAGSENFGKDGRLANGGWEKGASGLRAKGQRSILEAMNAKKTKGAIQSGSGSKLQELEDAIDADSNNEYHASEGDALVEKQNIQPAILQPQKKQIFQNLCIYVNGSTAPLISDHKLKQLLAEHGARMSIALGRRTVTHVIIGANCGRGGAGGGLAGSKIQKEIAKIGGKGVKFVGPEW